MIHEYCSLYRPDLEPKQRFEMSLFEINERIAHLARDLDTSVRSIEDVDAILRHRLPADREAHSAPHPVKTLQREKLELRSLLLMRVELIERAAQSMGWATARRISHDVDDKLASMGISPDDYGFMSYQNLLLGMHPMPA